MLLCQMGTKVLLMMLLSMDAAVSCGLVRQRAEEASREEENASDEGAVKGVTSAMRWANLSHTWQPE